MARKHELVVTARPRSARTQERATRRGACTNYGSRGPPWKITTSVAGDAQAANTCWMETARGLPGPLHGLRIHGTQPSTRESGLTHTRTHKNEVHRLAPRPLLGA